MEELRKITWTALNKETLKRNWNIQRVRIVQEELHIYFIKVTKKLKAYGCSEIGC
jgi:hypothetical protein